MKLRKLYLILVLIIVLNSCNESKTASNISELTRKRNDSVNNIKSVTVEEWLAIDDAEDSFHLDSVKVNQIKKLLNELSVMYKESIDTIARNTYLTKKGVNYCNPAVKESNLNILKEMQKLVKSNGEKYNEAVSNLMNKIHAMD